MVGFSAGCSSAVRGEHKGLEWACKNPAWFCYLKNLDFIGFWSRVMVWSLESSDTKLKDLRSNQQKLHDLYDVLRNFCKEDPEIKI